jgi:hypothetical protein
MFKVTFSPNKLAQIIEASELPTRQIARQLGHPNTTRLYRYRNGKMTPTADTIARLATILSCSPHDLLAEVQCD